MLIYFPAGDKKPAQRRAHSRVTVFSPADPYGVAVQSLNANAGGISDLLDDLVPGLGAFVLSPRDNDGLQLLHAWGGNDAL
jgi:hypothetical protein